MMLTDGIQITIRGWVVVEPGAASRTLELPTLVGGHSSSSEGFTVAGVEVRRFLSKVWGLFDRHEVRVPVAREHLLAALQRP